jgi:hypothetical protein
MIRAVRTAGSVEADVAPPLVRRRNLAGVVDSVAAVELADAVLAAGRSHRH